LLAINRHHAFAAVWFKISKWSRSVAQQGGGHATWGAGLGGASTHFI